MADLIFAEANPEKIINEMAAEYERLYREATGQTIALRPADTARLMIATATFAAEHLEALIDFSAKMNLLQYSRGEYLDALAYGVTDPRKDAVPAYTTVRIHFSTALAAAQTIAKGTRVTAGDGLYWQSEQDITAPAGATYADVRCICMVPGSAGNGYTAGQITTLVDTSNVRYFASLENTDTSSGGADRETDDEFRERIRIAPESSSTAGSEEAYKYHVKSYDANIADVRVVSATPGDVAIYIAMEDGTEPSGTYIAQLAAFISAKTKRPLTDHVAVSLPEKVSYTITASYTIHTDDAARETEIRAAVAAAVDSYAVWQSSRIGRDIDPSELIRRMKNAGASRVSVSSPVYTPLERGDYDAGSSSFDAVQIARLSTKTITYGGLVDG